METDERETETRELRELHWNFNNNNINRQQQQQQPQQRSQFVMAEEKTMDEPWLNPDFSQMTRKQQNCEIYRVSTAGKLTSVMSLKKLSKLQVFNSDLTQIKSYFDHLP